MKIVIISGEKNEVATGKNTKIIIDGVEITSSINKFWYSVEPGEVAKWGMSMKGETPVERTVVCSCGNLYYKRQKMDHECHVMNFTNQYEAMKAALLVIKCKEKYATSNTN